MNPGSQTAVLAAPSIGHLVRTDRFAVRYDIRTKRPSSGAGLLEIEVQAFAQDDDGGTEREAGRLIATQVIDPLLTSLMIGEEAERSVVRGCVEEAWMDQAPNELEDLSYDAIMAMEELVRIALGDRFAASTLAGIVRAKPTSLLYIDCLVVHPFARGRHLGLGMLRELRMALQGAPVLACLTACPLSDSEVGLDDEDEPGRDPISEREDLVGYYESDPQLGFHRPRGEGSLGALLVALWNGFDAVGDDRSVGGRIQRNTG